VPGNLFYMNLWTQLETNFVVLVRARKVNIHVASKAELHLNPNCPLKVLKSWPFAAFVGREAMRQSVLYKAAKAAQPRSCIQTEKSFIRFIRNSR